MITASGKHSAKASPKRILTSKRAVTSAVIGVGTLTCLSMSLLSAGALTRGVTSTPALPRGVTSASALPHGVTLRQIDGGPHYFAHISARSAWMDQHILLGAWLEQPQSATEVRYDRATGDNIYWNLAGSPTDPANYRVNYNIIRRGGMHVSAPDTTAESGSETVSYDGGDESDMVYGPGWDEWNKKTCVPPQNQGGQCGYTVARWYYRGTPANLGSPGYKVAHTVKHQGFGKGVLFWETPTQAAEFLRFTDILSADSYWMTDSALNAASQGGCALFPQSNTICDGGNGVGLTNPQRALPANYAYNVTKLESLQALNGPSKPVVVDVETGCPGFGNNCTTPPAMKAAAWHALIAGARGIIWFQHNFGGPCQDDRSIIDGSNPGSSIYHCQQTPGVTLHDMVQALTRFNTEVIKLNKVLLSPFAEHYVTARGDVSVMTKYSNGRFYIFAGAGRPGEPPRPDQKVTFRLAGEPDTKVAVVNEHRTLQITNGEFSDTFANSNTVHIYVVN
jgi:hypothetical protein